MLSLKDLENRVYSGKECVGFQLSLSNGSSCSINATFSREGSTGIEMSPKWTMLVLIPRTAFKDSDVYCIHYEMPRNDLPLTLVAACGLRLLQAQLKEEVQSKSDLDFLIGDITKGM